MWLNRYKDSPLHKTLLKEILFTARYAALHLRNGFRTRTVLFYPEFPLYKTHINRYLLGSRFNITNNPDLPFDLVVAWEDTTHRPCYPLLERLSSQYRVLNLACRDISKRRVDEVSRAVFGYGLCVDPTTYEGRCVRKSDDNGDHDKTAIIQGPIECVDEDCVYQPLVDNRYDEHLVYDIRVQICGDRMPLVFLRFRSLDRRFSSDLSEAVYAPRACLSDDEIEKLHTLASYMGLDFGDIDAVRDAGNGRLYVVDVNNTPQQAAADVHLSSTDRRRHIRDGRAALKQAFLEPVAEPSEPRSRPVRL